MLYENRLILNYLHYKVSLATIIDVQHYLHYTRRKKNTTYWTYYIAFAYNICIYIAGTIQHHDRPTDDGDRGKKWLERFKA